MPVIRNPFRKNAPPPLPDVTVERLGSPRPESLRDDDRSASRTSLHRPDDVERPLATPRSTSAISIARDDDANAYKMSGMLPRLDWVRRHMDLHLQPLLRNERHEVVLIVKCASGQRQWCLSSGISSCATVFGGVAALWNLK